MINKIAVKLLLSILVTIAVSGCTKYQEVADAEYPEEKVYMPASVKGIYDISVIVNPLQIPTSDSAYRYVVDRLNNKLVIPLGVVRSGITKSGEVSVTLSAAEDTVRSLVSGGDLTDADLLPAGNYTFPEKVLIPGNQDFVTFNVLVDLPYVVANADKKLAFAITIREANRQINDEFKTTIVLIDPSKLKL